MGKKIHMNLLPKIVTNSNRLRDLTAAAIDALMLANSRSPRIFRRGGVLVRIVRDGDALLARELNVSALRGELERAADFVRLIDKDDEEGQPVAPPFDVVQDVLALPELPFPELREILHAPVVLPDGRLLTKHGYDSSSGVFADLDGLGDVESLSRMNAKEALPLLREELLGDFAFRDECDRTHALAALLTPTVRPLIKGPTPLFAVTSSTPGTGKGLFVDLVSEIAFGQKPGVIAKPDDEDELRRHVTSLLLEGHPAILFDNIVELRSAVLSAALTSEMWQERIVRSNRIPRLPNNALWFATGNNPRLSDEISRRTIPIRLEALLERPEERTGFRHEDIKAWARAHRAQLVGACVSLVRAWLDAGIPLGTTRLGSFEGWSSVLGGVFGVLGVGAFLGGRDLYRVDVDLETDDWRAFVQAWGERFASTSVSASDLHGLLKEKTLLPTLWEGRLPLAAAQRIGHAILHRLNRVYGTWRLRRGERDTKTKAVSYFLELIGGSKGRGPKTPETPPHKDKCETDPKTESRTTEGAKEKAS